MNGERLIYIDFLQCIRAVFRKWPALLATAGLGILIAGAATFLLSGQEDVYQSTSSVYCVGEGSYNQTAESVQLMNIYGDIIQSSRVAERANSILGNAYPDAEVILNMIQVDYGDEETMNYSAANNSIVIKITAQSVNEKEAVDVANATAEAFAMEMSTILRNSDIQMLDAARNANVVYEAEKQNVMHIAIGAVVGFFLAMVWIAIKEIFVVNLNEVKDGTLFGKLDIIGVIPDFNQN
ncbi:MAG: hypothetical protein IJW37_08920 [Lachnospiraceae bacterium]|nr:hypothetical protein [Lachnospiraceae bacterium]